MGHARSGVAEDSTEAPEDAPPPTVEFQDVPTDEPAVPPMPAPTPAPQSTPNARVDRPPAVAAPAPSAPATRAPPAATVHVPARPFPNIFPVFRQHAEQAKSERVGESLAKLVLGAAAIPVGIASDVAWNNSYGSIIWISGIGVVASGVLTLVFPSPFERMADRHRVFANTNPTPREEARLMRAWGSVAEEVRSSRITSAWTGVIVGVLLGAAGGVMVGTDIGDIDDQTRQDWATGLILAGAVTAGDGVAGFFVEAPVERSYKAYKASVMGEDSPSTMPVQLGFTPTPGGAAMVLGTSF